MDHLALLEQTTGLFLRDLERRDLAASDPDAALAAIDWSVTELAAHLGGVHRWAAGVAGGAAWTPRENTLSAPVPVLEWYRESRAVLLATLRRADPASVVWTMQQTDRTVRFWHRRQLHETVVHLWDLRSAIADQAQATPDPPGELGPDVFADTIDELLTMLVKRFTDLEPLPAPIELVASDIARRWLVAADWTVSEGRSTVGGRADAAASVVGEAGALALFAWNRYPSDDPRLTISGDRAVVDAFSRAKMRP